MTTTDQSEKNKKITNSEKVFETNRTVEDIDIKKQLKPGHPPRKRRARTIA